MSSNNTNSFDTNYSQEIKKSKNFVRGLKRERRVCAVVHFDLTKSTKKMIKNQEETITEMLNHNRICRDLIVKNDGTVIK